MDIVDILQSEFLKRQTKNSRYSLRAFAQNLGIQSATLSAILKRKRSLPPANVAKLLSDLNLSAADKKTIWKSMKIPLKASSLKQFWERPQIEIDSTNLAVVKEWEYGAVMSLCKLNDFQPNCKWVSERLGITLARATTVWENLISLSLLKKDELGAYQQCWENLRITTALPSKALREGHLQELQIAKKKLEDVPMHLRNFSSLTFAMNSKKMSEANDLIRKFIQQMDNDLERGPVNEVYQLAIQLYPLTVLKPEAQ